MIAMFTLVAALQAVPALPAPTAKTFRDARKALDVRLIDLPSARFRDVHATEGVVCGYVNARNRMGGYAGWQPFVATVFSEDQTAWLGEEDRIMIETFCVGDRALDAATRDYSSEMSGPAR